MLKGIIALIHSIAALEVLCTMPLFNRQQLPMPMETAPKAGTVVYVVDPSMENKKECWMAWTNTPYQVMLLDRGLVHSTSEAAIEWANAMIPFNNK